MRDWEGERRGLGVYTEARFGGGGGGWVFFLLCGMRAEGGF